MTITRPFPHPRRCEYGLQATNGAAAEVPLPSGLAGIQLVLSGNFNSFITAIVTNGQTITFSIGITLTLNGNLALSGKVNGRVLNLGGFLGKRAKTIFAAAHLPNLPGAQPATLGLVRSFGLQGIGAAAVDLTGLMQIEGDYSQGPDGHLAFALASLTSYDRLQLSGNANLAGTIVLVPIDSAGAFSSLPLPDGSTFDLLEARSIQLNGVTLAGPLGGKLQVIDLPNGRQALRATLQPATQGLAIQHTGTAVEISFPNDGSILEVSPNIGVGVWTPVGATNGTFSITAGAKPQFFRLKSL